MEQQQIKSCEDLQHEMCDDCGKCIDCNDCDCDE